MPKEDEQERKRPDPNQKMMDRLWQASERSRELAREMGEHAKAWRQARRKS
jgi:hypothetical protein